MLQANYSARSGIIAQQQRIDTIANNMANLSTTGYKSVRADFKDALYQTMTRVVQPQTDLNLQKGHGTLLGATTTDFRQGMAKQTFNPLDVMLEGDGFLAVKDKDGVINYTRDGSMYISVTQNQNESYLVDAQGSYIMDEKDNQINIKGYDPSDVEIASDGGVYLVDRVTDPATGIVTTTRTLAGKLKIMSFMNRNGLVAQGNNYFLPSEESGEAKADKLTTVEQGMLENSNVDLATEMTRLIRAQKAFSFASRALTTADEMDGKANQIRG